MLVAERKRVSIHELAGHTRAAGVRCPKCDCRHVPVYRTTHAGRVTIRERTCRHCGWRFETREFVAE